MKYTKQEAEESLKNLREMIKPGDKIWTLLCHVSASGMMRHIAVIKLEANVIGEIRPYYLNYKVACVLGYNTANDGSLKVGGCGMDMGFSVVNNLSDVLYPVYKCLGEKCGSGDHANGPKPIKRIKGRYTHKDGYAINQNWL